MYKAHFGLERRPFTKTPDPGMLFMSPAHEEALARLEQAVEDRELMLLSGEIGSGKTTLSRSLIDRLGDNYRVALILNPRLSPNQLLRTVAVRLGAEKPRYFRNDLIDQVNELLFECYDKDILPVIIIDEAQAIPTRDTFEEIRLLTNYQLDDSNLLSMILLAQPEIERRINHKAYEAFRQRIGIRFHLPALEQPDVGAYIRHRLERSGASGNIFQPDAIQAISRISRGVPRWINNIASSALLEAFGRDKDQVDEKVIIDVARDLGLQTDELNA